MSKKALGGKLGMVLVQAFGRTSGSQETQEEGPPQRMQFAKSPRPSYLEEMEQSTSVQNF